MLTHPTLQKLNDMKLTGMASAFCDQLARPLSDLDFETRFGLLVEQEWVTRDNRRLTRLLKQAKLKQQASIADISYGKMPPSKKSNMKFGNFFPDRRNAIFFEVEFNVFCGFLAVAL